MKHTTLLHHLKFFPFLVALLIPLFAVTARRLHDYGLSGWWQLSYITVIGIFVVLVWCMLPAKEDENQWGKNPLLES